MAAHMLTRRRVVPAVAVVAAVLVVVYLSGAFATGEPAAGAAGSAGTDGGRTVVRMTVPAGDQAYSDVVANFEKANPDIHVDLSTVPVASYGQLIMTRLRSGSAPDVLWTTPGTQTPYSVLNLAAAGHLTDLSGLALADQVPAEYRPALSKDGKLYAWPMGTGVIATYYDVDAFARLGLQPPGTFAELLSLCGKAKSAGKRLLLLPGGEQTFVALVISVLGTQEVYSTDPSWAERRNAGTVSFRDTPGWRRTFDQFVAMKDADCFPPQPAGVDATGAPRAWATGDTLATIGNTGYIGTLRAAAPQVRFSTFAFPASSSENTRVVLSPAQNLAVNAASANVAAATKVVEFFAQPEQSRLWNEREGSIAPVDQMAGRLPGIYRPLGPYFADGKVMVTKDYTSPGSAFLAAGASAQGLLTGQKSVSDVIADLDLAWDR